ncbi:MAG: Do family serine endopeptidase [Thermodesulfobacteriota bacterium]|nr:Do family serine endopeptidase [Thermodesulfobacteriota bacterium]
MGLKKRFSGVNLLVIVAVCSAFAGILVASALDWSPLASAETFWIEGTPDSTAMVRLPSINSLSLKVSPAVVNIRTIKTIKGNGLSVPFQRQGGDSFDDFFRKFFEQMPQQNMEQKSLGSGFIISSDGYILTNNHVISGADDIRVSLSDDKEFDAEVIGKDDNTDIALIKIDPKGKDLPVAVFGDSDGLRTGDWVIAIGNPFGLGHTLTQGIVSAKARIIGAGPYDNFIQTDAAINPGNSGGPLIDMKGNVVGINTAMVSGGQGIGFAVPINMARDVLPDLKSIGEVTRGWLGVGIQKVTPEIARAVGLETVRGAMVTKVYPDDPADRAGIKQGDIILRLNSKDIPDPHALTMLVGGLDPGDKVDIVVWRDNREIELGTRLKRRDDAHVDDSGKGPGLSSEVKDRFGISIMDITPEIAQRYGLEDTKGVIVSGIDPDGMAFGIIQPGDVIKEIASSPVETVNGYLSVVNGLKKGKTVLLRVIRQSRPLYVAMEVK